MSRVQFLNLVVVAALSTHVAISAWADETPAKDDAPAESDSSPSHWNVPMKTLGGRQFWGDVRFFHDWRIQHNILDGHYRLLDGADVRHAWGTREECERRLDEIRRDRKLPPMSGRAVIVVHGLIRSSKSFDPMKAELEKAGYRVFGFDYPSTRVEIPAAAEYLKQCVASLDGMTEINFVVHSMGGLVVRASLRDDPDPRIGRIVMLGVPNLGARMANLLQRYTLYRLVYGPAGQQLIEDDDGFVARLPVPACEFALIAGARGTPAGYNPLIPGDDDGTISLACTRLPGAKDFMTVGAVHSFLVRDPAVIAATVRFLCTGVLRESGETEPIPRMSNVTCPSADTSLRTSMP